MADYFVAQPGEVWKPVKDFPDYLISNHGRVRSITARKGSRANINGGLIKAHVGYQAKNTPACLKVSLRKDKKTFHTRVHRMVLEAFVGPCPEGLEGCHNDGDFTNNHVSNLRWDTHRANMHDQARHGTKSKPPILYGENHHNAKLTAEKVLAIRAFPVLPGARAELARKYNTSIPTIQRVLTRKVWKHV